MAEIFNICDVRGYPVIKSNYIIQRIIKRKQEMKLQEQKAVSFILSLIKEEDQKNEKHIYEFDVKTFCEVCGIEYFSTWNIEAVKKTLENLAINGIWIKDERKKKKETYFQWIASPQIIDDKTINIQIPDASFEYVSGLSRYFTKYELYQILPMKSCYSVAMYELIKSYEYQHEFTVTLENLKRYLGIINEETESGKEQEKYIEFKNFKRLILNTAKAEIDKYTDISFEWEGIREGKSYKMIRFTITKKDASEKLESLYQTKKALKE